MTGGWLSATLVVAQAGLRANSDREPLPPALIGFCLLLGACAVFGVVLMIRDFRKAKRRRADMATLAAELGLSFSPDGDKELAARLAAFESMRLGFGLAYPCTAYNVLQGNVGGRGFVACDFRFGGKDRIPYSAILATSDCPFDHLLIRPEGILDRMDWRADAGDIDFESQEFSDRFLVKCADRKFAYDVITPRMMDLLLDSDEWIIEVQGHDLLLWKGLAEVSPNELRDGIEFAGRFLDLVPEHVRRERAAGKAADGGASEPPGLKP
jgi:hypothetical protein